MIKIMAWTSPNAILSNSKKGNFTILCQLERRQWGLLPLPFSLLTMTGKILFRVNHAYIQGCIVVDYNCRYSILCVKVRFLQLGDLKTFQRRNHDGNPMVSWIVEQHCEWHRQCLSTPCSRGHQCIKTMSSGMNNSQLHLPPYTNPVSDTPADHTSTVANCFVLIA